MAHPALSALLIALLAPAEGVDGPPAPPPDGRGAFIAPASRACGACHPRHYREWAASVHAHAIRAESWAPRAAGGVPDAPDASDPLCAGCHGSLHALGSDRLLGRSLPPDHPLDLSHAAERSVSCTACHQVADEHGRKLPAEGECLPEGFSRPSIDVPFHRTQPTARVRRAEACGPCHETSSPSGVPLERTFSQYRASVFPARGITCASCHMRPFTGTMVPGGPLRYALHRHDMIGVDVAAAAVPDAGPQVERVLAFLRPAILVHLRAPATVEAGGEARLEIDLKNIGAGHHFPAGPPGERRMWLQVIATASGGRAGEGRTIFASGLIDARGDPAPDPHLVELSDRLLDAGGREVDDPAQAVLVEERSLRSMELRRVVRSIPVPRELVGAEVRVEVKVLLRAASAGRLERRGLASLIDRYPLLEIFRGEAGPIRVTERPAPPDTVRVPEDVPTIAEALRAVPAGGTVLLGPGEHIIRAPIVLDGRGVALRGREGAERTVIRLAEPIDPGRASVVMFTGGPGTIAGVTIEGGKGTREDGPSRGGGILCRDARAVISEVIIRGNEAEGDGGGILALRSKVRIDRSTVTRNSARGDGGGLASADSVMEILETRFAGNSARRGGALRSAGGRISLEDATLQGNWAERGGGACLEGEFAFDRARVEGNLARSGGGLAIEGAFAARIAGTLIAGNHAIERGGGVLLSGGARAEVVRSTVVENLSRVGGGVVGDRQSEARVRESIVWQNRPPVLTGSAEFSVVDDPRRRGGTNPEVLPLFEAGEGEWKDCAEPRPDDCVPLGSLDPAVGGPGWRRWEPGDFRPVTGSPAVDAGDPRSPPDPDGTRADLGAFSLPQPASGFRRGDVEGDGTVGPGDLVRLEERLASGVPLPCDDAGDFDDDGRLEPGDLAWLAAWWLHGTIPPAPPFPGCGIDRTLDDGLGCFESQPGCR